MLTQPVRPRQPWEPRKFFVHTERVEVEDATYDAELEVETATLNYLSLSPEALQAVIRTMNLVSNEKGISIEKLGFMCFDNVLYVTYDTTIENPHYEELMESYRRQVATYEADMVKYHKDYDEYERHVLEGQIIAARRRLEELEAKRKTT